jgi:RNA polymerase sigma-70 factor (ECF subfamily)
MGLARAAHEPEVMLRKSVDAGETPAAPTPLQSARFHDLYRDHFDFVFRNVRRLGVPASQVDDAVQDVFLVALKHIDKYVDGSHGKAWLFAIALRVARNYRRSHARKLSALAPLRESGLYERPGDPDPFEQTAKAQAARLLHSFLDGVDEDKRSVFIMTELEQMSAPEIAEALGVNLNTVYARIRAARREFARAVEALSARGRE